jgi:hypothetical protein
MTDLKEEVEQWIDQLVSELKGNVDSVTGETASKIFGEVKEVGLNIKGSIYAPIQLITAETGRGETKTNIAGSPTLQERLLKWIQAKGITPKGNMTQEQLSWAMATKIHKYGDDLYSRTPRGYKKSGVISDVINDQRIDAFVETFTEKATKIVKESFTQRLKSRAK